MSEPHTYPTDDGGAITGRVPTRDNYQRALDADNDGQPDYSEPASMVTREPLAIRGAIVAAVTAGLHLLVMLGVLPLDEAQDQQVALLVDLVGTAVLVVWTRGKVTPVADPRL